MIILRDVAKVYRMGDIAVHALRGVSLERADGEFVAIMGPSGSGKSTLMNILGCLDTPSAGSYLLDGIEVAGMTDDDLACCRGWRPSSRSSCRSPTRARRTGAGWPPRRWPPSGWPTAWTTVPPSCPAASSSASPSPARSSPGRA
jgi:energy-coupling factor transporter ATP-binding protein EcfA2